MNTLPQSTSIKVHGMKRTFLLLVLALTVLAVPVLAQQYNPQTPDEKLTEEHAAIRISQLKEKVADLEKRLNEVDGDITKARAELDRLNEELKKCNEALYALVGATQADIDAFAQKLGVLEGKVREMKRLSNDELADRRAEVEELDRQYKELQKNKISVMPQFYDRMVQLGRDIKGLYREKKITTYTVGTWAKDRDCLWNIAAKNDIYADAFMWPKIWQANTDQIRNPDIIFPGQVLQIPPKGPKTSDEQKAERRYWRQKREAAAGSTGDASSDAGTSSGN